jgi:peptidoglycan hydrolase-like protein with peptidoglycan-binding domain
MRKLFVMLVISFLAMGPALVGAQQQGRQQQGEQQQDQMAIREAQQQLKAMGLYEGPIDGRYGPETQEALRAYQGRHGLQVTGALTPETQKSLQAQQEKQQGQVTVREAQQYLKAEGFYAGPVDGIFGPETEEALREYQRAQGLQVTGSLTQETEQHLLARQAQKGGQQQSGQQAKAQSAMKGQHCMTGTVKRLNRDEGRLALQTDKGELQLHFPPQALSNVKEGDRITVQLAFTEAGGS